MKWFPDGVDTRRLPLGETPAAFKVFEDKVPDALRIVIEVIPE